MSFFGPFLDKQKRTRNTLFYVLSLEERTKELKSSKAIFKSAIAALKPLTFFRFMLVPRTRDAIPAQNAAIAAEDFLFEYLTF